MAAIVYITIRSTTYYTQRVQWANNQLEAVTALTVNANRYSEQIAEFLLIGEPERPDYESARAELEAGFEKLAELTRGEAEFLGGSSEQEDGGDEIFRVTRMRTLYGEIAKATSDAINLRNQGRQEDAVSAFSPGHRESFSMPSSKTSWKPRGATKRKRSCEPSCRQKHCGDA
ncbi:hypothetical protein ACN2CC_10560 [Mesorhizobium muleiense]|uniref:CHASE3 domain-containing protein n=1 Tax=Mesorhizobium muleiense TaxID=1004279 RepID=UPI003AFB17DC